MDFSPCIVAGIAQEGHGFGVSAVRDVRAVSVVDQYLEREDS